MNKALKSKTRVVRILLLVRPTIVLLWRVTPNFISAFLLNVCRNTSGKIGFVVRYLALNKLTKSCGEKVVVFPGVYFKNISNLEVGTNVSIHEMSYIDAFGGIVIGDNVAISHNVSIISFDHEIYGLNVPIKDAPPIPGKIIVGNNIWIGAGVRLLKGVTIANNCVIAAGSVVKHSVEANSIVAGVPAKLIKHISNNSI